MGANKKKKQQGKRNKAQRKAELKQRQEGKGK